MSQRHFLRGALLAAALLVPASQLFAQVMVDYGFGPIVIQPIMVAGDPNGTPPDSPANRVDPNTTDSRFAGVGSLRLQSSNGTFICSAAAISDRHILTAAHCLDLIGSNGTIDLQPSDVTFNLNFGGNLSHQITASKLSIHPDYTGFNNPSVNDDLAVITLSQPLPDGVPIYPIHFDPIPLGTQIISVGYGRSGSGIAGYTTGASFTTKRVGENVIDATANDDEGGGLAEVFFLDFDAPDGSNGGLGGPSLGNARETEFGGGDSGGPSFIDVNGQLKIVGVNTFIFSFSGGPAPPFFGSGSGGMLLSGYEAYVGNFVPEPASCLTWVGIALVGGWQYRRNRRRAAA